jgi:hypothetical protein
MGLRPALAAANREYSISEVELPKDCILGYFQPSPFDKLRAGSVGLYLERVVLTQTLNSLSGGDLRANMALISQTGPDMRP